MFKKVSLSAVLVLLGLIAWAEEDSATVFTLDAISITATPIEDDFDSTTAMKVEVPLLDTPQQVSVIDQEVMLEQQDNTVAGILKNDASISNRGNFGAADSYAGRGFPLDSSGNYLMDGRTMLFVEPPAVETLERVDVLKGPAAFLYGQGAPGATINFISKKPEGENFVTPLVQLGSYDYYRAHVDGNYMSPELDGLGMRLNVAAEDANGFNDTFYKQRQLVSMVLGYQPSEGGSHTLGHFTYQHSKTPQDTGLVAIGNGVIDLPVTTSLNQGWTVNDQEDIDVGVRGAYETNSRWTVYQSLNFQYVDRDRILANIVNIDDDAQTARYSIYRREDTWQYYTAIIDAAAEYQPFGINNEILLGANYTRIEHDNRETARQTSNTFALNDIPKLSKPDFGGFMPTNTVATDNIAVYGQDIISILPKWDVVLGARYDSYWVSANHAENYTEQNVTPRAALLYKMRDNLTTYLSYSESFEINEPVSNNNAVNNGEHLDPTISKQVEWGVKGEWFNQRLLTSVALFVIKRENEPVTEDLTQPIDGKEQIVRQRGEQTHKGIDATAQGHINDRWLMVGSLMLLDAHFGDDNADDVVGNRPASVPKYAASLWSSYDLMQRARDSFSINGGVFYESDRYGDDQNSFELGSFARTDIGAGYEYRDSSYQFNTRITLENVFDEEYFYAYRRTNVTVGRPRSVWFTVSLKIN